MASLCFDEMCCKFERFIRHVSFTMDLDPFVEPIFSMNLNCCTAQLTPSPIASENLITITEVIPSPNWFSFWSYSEKR